MPEKLKMHSPDLVGSNIDRIAELFPNCVTEAAGDDGQVTRKIDFDLLRQELSDEIVEGPLERYHLNWPGKREAMLAANAPIAKTLRPCREESVDFDTTQNLFIEGDNLEALKLLQETYLGKVKMIYIDPPYNRGEDAIYRDSFQQDATAYLHASSQTDDSTGKLVTNSELNGRFHSDWLTMLHSRLRVARNLLAEDGVICASISDVELSNLKSILNEVFGEDNHVNTVSVLAKVGAGASGGGEDKRLKKNIEYILVYARDLSKLNVLSQIHTSRPLLEVVDEMRAAGESWKYTSIMGEKGPRTHFRDIEDGDGNPIKIFKRQLLERKTIRSVMANEGISEKDAYNKYFEDIFSDTNAQTSIRERVIDAVGSLEDGELLEVEYVPRSGRDKGQTVLHTYISRSVRRVIWLGDSAEREEDEIVKKDRLGTFWEDFDYNNVGREGQIPYPDGKKPVDLLRTCVRLYQKNDGMFLDFFAGSGTLAHAVIQQNHSDFGTRRFLLVQLPEELKNTSRYKAALEFYAENGIPAVASEVCKERVRRVGSELAEQSLLTEQTLDTGFRVLKIDSSNMKDVYYSPAETSQAMLGGLVDNIKDGRTGEDLLFQVLLDCGVDLGLPIKVETLEGCEVFFVNDSEHAAPDLVACFDAEVPESLVKTIAAKSPLRAVFRDGCFATDADKINVEQVFKQMSPQTQLRSL